MKRDKVSLDKDFMDTHIKQETSEIVSVIEKEYKDRFKKIEALKRCSKCLLPETMPFIEFDNQGVCNYCKNYKR